MSEGVGDLLFFLASVLPVGWGISKVLTFVDERGLRGISCISTPKAVSKGRLHDRAKMARMRQKLERFQ